MSVGAPLPDFTQSAVRVREETVHGIYRMSIRVMDAQGRETDPFETANLLEDGGSKAGADVVRGLIGEVVRLRDELRVRVRFDRGLIKAVLEADVRLAELGIAKNEGERRDVRIALAEAILAECERESP